MGNCLRHESRISDDGDEWEDFPAGRRVVKIKMTKKQLKELVGKMEVKELSSVEQVLAHFINHSPQHPWRPALHTIPED
ncbi:hypothetical protein Fmac_030636 [Flemingia macrophylla]|uniref:Uncharacterized protein n=1 Tax=Flemingia macrophylla TaxID=520843 RepID=A0ABD1L115_9FABA